MKCPKCGYENKDGADHCDLCKEIMAKPPDLSRPTINRYQPARSMEEPPRRERPIIPSPVEGKIDHMEAIKFGWEAMKKHFWLFIGIGAAAIGIYGIEWIVQMIVTGGSKEFSFVFILLQLVFMYLNLVIFTLGYGKMCLKIADGEGPEFSDIFSCFHLGWRFILASLLIGLIIGLSIVPAIILWFPLVLFKNNQPAFVVSMIFYLIIILITASAIAITSVRFYFMKYIIIDKETGPIESVKSCWNMTKGNFWNLANFILWISLVILAGALCLGVGLIAAVPTASVAVAYYYRQLSKRL